MANARLNIDLHDEQEQWLSIFQQCYGDTISMQDVQELKPAFVLSIYIQFVKITLNANLDNMRMVRFFLY